MDVIIPDEARLFYVVDSSEDNEEIFETYGEAEAYFETLSPTREDDEVGDSNHRRIYIGIVNNTYKNTDHFEYDDFSDTFMHIKTIKEDVK